MKRPLTYRIQEWAADRFSWAQYPNVSAADMRTKNSGKLPFFKNPMPLSRRIDVFLMSLVLLIVASVLIAVIATAVYSLFKPG